MTACRKAVAAGALVSTLGCGGAATPSGPTPSGPTPSGPSTGPDSRAALYFPGEDASWETVTSLDGWNAAALDDALKYAGDHATRSIVILQNGRILAERHWSADRTYRRDIASAQKSVVAVLVGLAQERQILSIDDPVSRHLGSGWTNDTDRAEAPIRVRHLITMTSGLDETLRVREAPGAAWLYNNDAYHQVQPLLERAAGRGIQELSRTWLFEPLGIGTSSLWYPRATMIDARGKPMWGLLMTARDMARFGLMIQAGGYWADREIVRDRGYLEAALLPSQALNPSYGYLWWLNGQPAHVLPPAIRQPGPLVPAAPADLVSALGADDQKIYVSRSTGLVVTRLGESAGPRAAAPSSFDSQIWSRIMAARTR